MPKAKIVINHQTVQQYLDGGGGIDKLLTEHANRVLSAAKANAPVRTGEYQRSLRTWLTHTDRAVARVGSDSGHAWIVEHATGNLARALGAKK